MDAEMDSVNSMDVEMETRRVSDWRRCVIRIAEFTEKYVFIWLCWLLLFGYVASILVMCSVNVFQLPEFWVDSAAVSQLNFNVNNNSEITATWFLTISAINPNTKWGIRYVNIEAMIFYGNSRDDSHKHVLAMKPVSTPFFLDPKDMTAINFKLTTVKTYMGKQVAEQVLEDMNRKSSVTFGLRLLVWYNRSMQNFGDTENSEHGIELLRFFCDQVEFGIFPNHQIGILTSGHMVCKQYTRNWDLLA